MTVACEDESIEVHKLVLSANSSFFRKILQNSKQNQSYIYIRGLAYQDLLSIVNFMYQGETKVPGENLARFIKAAQELDIRGLGADQIKGSLPNTSLESPSSGGTPSSTKRTHTGRKVLEAVKELDETDRKDELDDSNLYEIVGGVEMTANCSFGRELSLISHRMNKMKQAKLKNISRMKESITEQYNPNDTMDSVLPQGEGEEDETFSDELREAEESTDSAMTIDGSAASDQNAQLELEISMRRTKIRYQVYILS